MGLLQWRPVGQGVVHAVFACEFFQILTLGVRAVRLSDGHQVVWLLGVQANRTSLG